MDQRKEKQIEQNRNKNRSFHANRFDHAYSRIGDLTYEYNADTGLAYASPVRGVWNIVHIATLVPEGHQIFVCPTSCLRGVVLTTAEMGAMDKLSTITVGEDNILEGDMEEMLYAGTERIIRELPRKPRMIMIFTSCIHHFMAVNYHRVYKLLQDKYPEIDFVDCYMDPIMRRTAPVVPSLWRQLHRALKPVDGLNLKQVNLIGNCFPHKKESCDLTALLYNNGINIVELNSCRTYDEFQTESESCCNFIFHNHGIKAAKDMEIRLKQKWYKLRPGYSYEEYDQDLMEISRMLGISPPSIRELEELKSRVEDKVEETRRLFNGLPVSIDYTAVDHPLELALYLIRHGFRVESVYVDVFTERQEIFESLKEKNPDLKIYQTSGWNMRQMDRHRKEKILCIGQKAAYFNDSNHFVNVIENEGMYGYRGILTLMEAMVQAYKEEKPMKELVQIKGWGCNCI